MVNQLVFCSRNFFFKYWLVTLVTLHHMSGIQKIRKCFILNQSYLKILQYNEWIHATWSWHSNKFCDRSESNWIFLGFDSFEGLLGLGLRLVNQCNKIYLHTTFHKLIFIEFSIPINIQDFEGVGGPLQCSVLVKITF